MEHAPRENKRSEPTSVGTLKSAIRRARIESADRSEVVAELRGAEIARLEMLQDSLSDLLAQIPDDIDMFDTGLVPGEHPRLFIDMLAFVEMGRDKRHYRFVQDTRYGRITIAESDHIPPMVEAITTYIARRLVEREKALASDLTLPPPGPVPGKPGSIPGDPVSEAAAATPVARASAARVAKAPRSILRILTNIITLLLVCLLLAAAAYLGWREWAHLP